MDKLALLSQEEVSGVVIPEGISLDGITDYFSISTDFTGNADSKLFTYCENIYRVNTVLQYLYDADGKFQIYINASNQLVILGKNSAGTTILNATVTSPLVPKDTYANIQISLDLANASNRQIYINDALATVTWTTYTNDSIDFTVPNHYFFSLVSTASKFKGRSFGKFLSRERIDLSIVANRRIFLNSDGTANTKYYSDYLTAGFGSVTYSFPFKTSSESHINDTVNGNMTQNGILATADVGANEWQCKASLFNGTSQYLSRTSLTGIADSKTIVNSFNFKPSGTATKRIFRIADSVNGFGFNILSEYSGGFFRIRLLGYNSVGTIILNASTDYVFPPDSQHTISFSFDLSNVANRRILADNTELNVTWTTYIDDFIDLTLSNFICDIGRVATTYYVGVLGEFYFNTILDDLSAFWDSVNNKPIPVRKAMQDLGSNPLICSPISADNPTANYGSGGVWTLNGGGLVGARGTSEYISRSIVVDGTKYLTGSVFCQSLVKWKSIDGGVTWTATYSNSETVTNIGNGTDNGVVSYYFGFSDNINWALESNKNLVTNQLGYPRLPSKVISESGWTPVLGLFFNDSTNFGLNEYGVDYTVTGVIASSADVKI